MENHWMIDIETTGTDKDKDEILEIALVELAQGADGFWFMTEKEYHKILYYAGKPETEFAKTHMASLYEKCNNADPSINYASVGEDIRAFIHGYSEHSTPQFFMGWNASGFDMEFMFKKGLLTPSYYELDEKTGKEALKGDAHYRVYEQTGALKLVSDATGLSSKAVKTLAEDLNPANIKPPKGKAHDALYDCYWQTIMMNGLIEISRSGFGKFKK